MNAAEANAIPMSEILANIGYTPSKSGSNTDLWYYSPFRKEKTPSFHVNILKNVWFDHGEGRGGSVIDFVCARLQQHREDHTVADALRWLNTMVVKPSRITYFPQGAPAEDEPALILQRVLFLQSYILKRYLHDRGIPVELADQYLKQIYVTNKRTNRNFYALGIRNESNGYELRNEFFKGSLISKHITFIRGVKTSEGEIHVFESFMDFLSALLYQKENRFEHDVIILNSLSCISKALPYIETVPYEIIHTWFDNDAAGNKATEAFHKFATLNGVHHAPMNVIYAPHKDVNAWHMNKLGL